MRTVNPTKQITDELQYAYDVFNKELFGRQLPSCLITLQRKEHRVMGHYCKDRFASTRDGDVTTDEIAMNPQHFADADQTEILQTLLHEMCHLWQCRFGDPSRAGYHNKEWAAKMIEVGLMPTDTGKPGGKTTGQRMGDYPIANGPFARLAAEMFANGYRVSWFDRQKPKPRKAASASAGADGEGAGDASSGRTKSGQRRKFTCPSCKANAYGKSSLTLICGGCDERMT